MPFCFLLLLAQYVPTDFKAELFGGYANLRAEKQTQHGWTATYTDYSLFRRWASRPKHRRRPILEPISSQAPTEPPAQTAFTFGFAQSIDWKQNKKWAVRVQPRFRFLRLDVPCGRRRTILATPLAIGLVYKFGDR